jgi:hypothetical protein
MTWPNGDYYKGRFMHGKANGTGIFHLASGIEYRGQFINDDIVQGQRISTFERY